MYRKKSQHIPSDVESVALGTLLVGMRQLYAETTQYMKSRIERLEERYNILMGIRTEPPLNEAVAAAFQKKNHTRRGPDLKPRKRARSYGWPGTPEKRSQEMMRRMAVARGEAPARQDKNQKLSRERKKQWAALSPKRRKERLAKMQAGKAAKQIPTVQMEQAS